MLWSEWYAWLQVEHGSKIKGDHLQIPFKLEALSLWKALKSKISYDCVVIEEYRTIRTKKSFGKLSFH